MVTVDKKERKPPYPLLIKMLIYLLIVFFYCVLKHFKCKMETLIISVILTFYFLLFYKFMNGRHDVIGF